MPDTEHLASLSIRNIGRIRLRSEICRSALPHICQSRGNEGPLGFVQMAPVDVGEQDVGDRIGTSLTADNSRASGKS